MKELDLHQSLATVRMQVYEDYRGLKPAAPLRWSGPLPPRSSAGSSTQIASSILAPRCRSWSWSCRQTALSRCNRCWGNAYTSRNRKATLETVSWKPVASRSDIRSCVIRVDAVSPASACNARPPATPRRSAAPPP